ncbi:phage head spike fiber domain-containing protein [Celeribacter baekdonensis]|uniref:phage head spike fiber domain-containing protein n=1 Tax=Pseudomonadota TaxID=1224 RepID=UPI003A94A129
MALPLLSPALVTALSSVDQRRNLVPYSEDASQWAVVGTTVSGPLGLNALGQFSGYAIASSGSQWHRSTIVELPVLAGEIYSVRLFVRTGTSGSMRIMARYIDTTTTSDNLVGAPGSLPASSGSIALVSDTLREDGLTYEIVFRVTAPRATNFQLGLGPNSNAAGENIIALAAQVELGATATAYQPTP